MPGGLQRNPLTGAVQRNSATGGIRRIGASSSICCCRSTCPCGVSSTGLPDIIPVTFSGVTIPTGCLYSEVIHINPFGVIASSSWVFDSVPIDQKFCLHRQTGECIWKASVPAHMSLWGGTLLPDGTGELCICTGNYGSCPESTFDTLGIELAVFGGASGATPLLFAYLYNAASPFDMFGGFSIFEAIDPSVTIPCSGTVTVNNLQTYYRTGIRDEIHSTYTTDPGGTCSFSSPGCPGAPASYGGSALIDTTGAACP